MPIIFCLSSYSFSFRFNSNSELVHEHVKFPGLLKSKHYMYMYININKYYFDISVCSHRCN